MIQSFRDSIADSEKLRTLFEHCVSELHLPGEYDDLLRMGIVYCLSALDKLIHDIVIHCMVETFVGRRPPTARFLAEPISMDHHSSLSQATMPPAEIVFEGIVREKLAHLSFMDPNKLAEALSLVWDENHKWYVIATEMGRDRSLVVTELKNLHKRRNAIVHEADKDPGAGQKMALLPDDVERAEVFILSLGEAIHRLV